LRIADDLELTAAPSDRELSGLRELHARTRAAHANGALHA
jgi:hypothetical protein